MKVQELFEAYTPPAKNKKLGFRKEAGIPVGGSKEWLKTFGATQQDIEQALRIVRQSPEYKRVKALGMDDQSGERHEKNGSIMFVGYMNSPTKRGIAQRRWKLTVQPNGKIDETAPNDIHRAPMRTGKPRIVPGDPVQSIAKTMQAALSKMADNLENRRKKEQKELAAFKKASAK